MRTTLFPTTVILIAAASFPLFGGQPMYVALCNDARLDDKTLGKARHEVEATFDAAGAHVNWVACDDVATVRAQTGNRLLVVRLRVNVWFANRSGSLGVMGFAYTEERGSGYLADVYVTSIVKFREHYCIELATLVGLVICHELGHLILGPGHTEDGIMFAHWTKRQAEAGRKGCLRFNKQEGPVIVQELQKRGA